MANITSVPEVKKETVYSGPAPQSSQGTVYNGPSPASAGGTVYGGPAPHTGGTAYGGPNGTAYSGPGSPGTVYNPRQTAAQQQAGPAGHSEATKAAGIFFLIA